MSTQTKTAKSGSAQASKTPKQLLNEQMRMGYLDTLKINGVAVENGDAVLEQKCRRQLEEIGAKFYKANVGLAASLARNFMLSKSTDNHDDYVAAGVMGLWEAFLKWDPAQSTFGTFSRSYIAGRVRRQVRSIEYDHISYSDFGSRRDVNMSVAVLEKELGRNPSHKEVATHCGHTALLVERVRQPQTASLDKPIGEGGATLADIVGPNVSAADWFNGFDETGCVVDQIRRVTACLNAKELFVIVRRTSGLDPAPEQTLNGIADLMELGREVLRRVELVARAKIVEHGHQLPSPGA